MRKIGLLGGSFNPAHAGHLHISLEALHRLDLDEVWWILSPSSPLKDPTSYISYEERYEMARIVIGENKRILISDYEKRHNLRYSYQTITRILREFRKDKFIWLMGADNLYNFHKWRKWRWIMENIAVVILDRSPYSHNAMQAKTAISYNGFYISERYIGKLWDNIPPCWSFIHCKRNSLSSTEIRSDTPFP